MRHTVTVTVTAAHIAQGSPQCSFACPIALAVRDALERAGLCGPDTTGTDYYLDVGPYVVAIVHPRTGLHLAGTLPSSAQHFIAQFDVTPYVAPRVVGGMQFELTLHQYDTADAMFRVARQMDRDSRH